MDFALFILLNAILLIRPAELIPEIATVPLYYIAIIATSIVAAPAVARQLTSDALAARPITVCVLLLLPAVLLSHLTHGLIGVSLASAYDFAQVALYYLLLVGIVNTPARLRAFLKWVFAFILVLTGSALAQFHGYIDIQSLAELEQREIDPASGEIYSVMRLVSTGIFNDPNDLSVLLSVGLMIAFWLWGESTSLHWRAQWVVIVGLLGYALTLTQSRGGLLSFLTGLLTMIAVRYGKRKGFIIAAVALPVMLLVIAGRQTNINISDKANTAQTRIQLWSEGLLLFQQAPFFGIGKGEFAEEVGQVAHNSYVHAFTELGFFGGACFSGAFYLGISGIYRLGKYPVEYPDDGHARLRPFMLSMLAAYAMGLYSLSRNFVVPTYLILGLGTAYLDLIPAAKAVLPEFDSRLIRRLILVGLAVIVYHYLFVRIFAVR